MKTKTGKEIAKKRLWLTRTFIKELMKDLKCDDEY
jgi:HD superfamily phosphodiesterase